MIIAGDKNQFAGSHGKSNAGKHRYIEEHASLIQLPLPVADYIRVNDKVQDVIDRSKKRGVASKKMDFLGTYNFAVDTKKSLVEVAGCICNSKNHARIENDLVIAKNNGIHIVWLIEENSGITCLEDMFKRGVKPVVQYGWGMKNGLPSWKVIHKTRVPYKTLGKALYSMQMNKEKYDIEFLFCKPADAGAYILRLLGK